MGYRMFTSEKIFAQWQFGRVADYLLPPVQSFPTGRGEDLLWEWLSLYIHLSARCVCKWVCPVWGLCRCTAGVAPPPSRLPEPQAKFGRILLGNSPAADFALQGRGILNKHQVVFFIPPYNGIKQKIPLSHKQRLRNQRARGAKICAASVMVRSRYYRKSAEIFYIFCEKSYF